MSIFRDGWIERSWRWILRWFTHPGYVTTTDATPTVILTIATHTDETLVIEAKCCGVRADAGNEAAEGATYLLLASYRNDAGVVSAIGTPTSDALEEDTVAWDCQFNINGTDIEIKVTGEVGKDINWVAWAIRTYVEV